MPPVPRLMKLTGILEEHQRIFSTLVAVNEELGLNAVLRVAGGWVRDAILHEHCNDIDIAIETRSGGIEPVSGERFAKAVSEYVAAQDDARARTVSTIRANPAMSKHIETATVCVHNIPIEFCALRTDDYSEDSRIPQVRAATPEEDALRRDFTVNALFYNLHTGDVEDYTTGFDDLEKRVLRCPLDPRQTLRDDPLRLLRGVRFVGQLGDMNFRLSDDIATCVDDELLRMLLLKVSRERIGKELTKMLSCARPERCVAILHSMRLLREVLLVEVYLKQQPGKKAVSAEIDRVVPLAQSGPSDAFVLLEQLNDVIVPLLGKGRDGTADEEEEGEMSAAAAFRFATEDKLMPTLYALLLPFFRGDGAAAPQAEVEARLYAVVVNGMKMPVAVFEGLRRMVHAYTALRTAALTLADLAAPSTPETKGKLLQALESVHNRSVYANAFQLVLATYVLTELRPDVLQRRNSAEAAALFAPLWRGLEAETNLLNAFSLELPLSGTDARKLKGVQPKQVGEILSFVRTELVLNPAATKEELMEGIKHRFLSE